jgi:predicted membrane protein
LDYNLIIKKMERYSCKNSKHHKNRKNRVGIIFLIIGLVLLGKNLHMFPMFMYPMFFSWPMLLLAIGLIQILLNRRNVGGYILMAIGGLFLWNKMIPFSPVQWQIAWPGLFIFVGFILIFGYLIKPSKQERKPEPKKKSNHDDVEFDIDKIEPIES